MSFQSAMSIRKDSIWSIDFHAFKTGTGRFHVRHYAVAEGANKDHSDGFVIYDAEEGRVGYDCPLAVPKYVQDFIERKAQDIQAYAFQLADTLNK